MKNVKRRSIFTWLYAFILLIPMFTIAVRCLYVVINKNAYQSYSGNPTYNVLYEYETNEVTQNSDIEVGNIYHFNLIYNDNTAFDIFTTVIYNYTNNSISNTYYLRDYKNVDTDNYIFRLQKNANFISLQVWDLDILQSVNTITQTSSWTNWSWDAPIYSIRSLGETAYENISICDLTIIPIIGVDIDTTGTLDNVFEYSIQQFVDKHGNGLINFFGLLEQYFMQSTTANALYFTFANWCLNYVLLVSCVWLLFSVLMWFINYCNYMLNTSFRKGHGD